MTSDRRARVEELFHEVLEAPTKERPELLDRSCAQDPELRIEVEALLDHYEKARGGVLNEPVFAGMTEGGDHPVSVGPYRIIRRIGEGGMGIVYEAEQERPRRRIAIKVLRPGLYGERQLRRFRLECEVLGQLTHPGIAHVYDAGDAEVAFSRGPTARLPFLAMELVRGRRLLEFVEQSGGRRSSRLELFAGICDAVHYAHQQAVIHRDLKPGNILVDEKGQPKVLDFGVARFLHDDAGLTQHTRTGDIIGTLNYMSPEQLLGRQSEVDVRTDVYSLGIILYEMLTGRPPYDPASGSITELALRIEQGSLPRLSSHDSTLRGDLEAITRASLSPARADRYPSAAALAEDIRRHLRGDPISARSESGWQAWRRFVRRHRTGVTAAASFVLLVATSSVVAWTLYSQARQARDVAEAERSEARDRLVDSYISGASAERAAGRRGKRLSSLASLTEAAAIRPSIEVRDGVIASLAHDDLELEHVLTGEGRITASAHWSWVAHSPTEGVSRVLRLNDLEEAHRVQGPALPIHVQKLSRDGRFLLVKYHPASFSQDEARCWVWDLTTGEPVLRLDAGEFVGSAATFGRTSDGTNWVALTELDGRIHFYQLPLGRPWKTFDPGMQVAALASDPDGSRIATVTAAGRLVVLEVEAGIRVESELPFAATTLLWKTDGMLVMGSTAGEIHVWDPGSNTTVRTLTGHQGYVYRIDLGADERLLASGAWDGTTRLWDLGSGEEIISPLHEEALGGFGERLVTHEGSQTSVYRYVPSLECQEIHTPSPFVGPASTAVHPNGRFLATASRSGIEIWDIDTERRLHEDPGRELRWIAFTGTEGEQLMALDGDSLLVWPVAPEDGGLLGRKEVLWTGGPYSTGGACIDRSTGTIMVSSRDEVTLLESGTGRKLASFPGYPGVGDPALHPSGRWGFTGMWRQGAAHVWDLETGEFLAEFQSKHVCGDFTRDGRFLFVSDGPSLTCLDVGTWHERYRIEDTVRGRSASRPCFSPDGRTVALGGSYDIRLFDIESGARLATLTPRKLLRISAICFTPGGEKIVALTQEQRIQIWDLRRIRAELEERGLDW